MLLYNVYYQHSAEFDRNTPLPNPEAARKNKVKYAECVNGAKQYLVPTDEGWIGIPIAPTED